ncbi:MAG TPA: chromate resistance protein ChrB domain-containing protein [Ktedonosporobacter sp.]|nr:chromate resistance protein ChrB domain-containing protein [Ktedonosporobacter sp.]
MKWVTWEQVGVDRMACAWLITKYLDPQAEFLFVPVGSAPLPEGAEPFDLPGARLSHHRGHCTFYTMLREYDLHDPILQHIARIIDEADTVQEVLLEPAAAGLDLICRGLRQISQNDLMALERGRLIYDALYAQLQAEAASAGKEERE